MKANIKKTKTAINHLKISENIDQVAALSFVQKSRLVTDKKQAGIGKLYNIIIANLKNTPNKNTKSSVIS